MINFKRGRDESNRLNGVGKTGDYDSKLECNSAMQVEYNHV